MKKTNLASAACPIARIVDIVGDWWSVLIVRDAMTGTRRFNEFASQLGLARNILAGRLKKLVGYGILDQVPASDGSAYNEYVLTERGRDLFYVLVALRQWSEKWVGIDEDEARLVDVKTRRPVKPLELHAGDGRLLTVDDVTLEGFAPRAKRTA